MARKRYQRGSLFPAKGEPKNGVWIGRWREDVIMPDGKIVRQPKWERLGTIKEFPTRRLALRELEKKLADINSPSYRARPLATFQDFADKWEREVLTQNKPSYQASERSRLKKHLKPFFGNFPLKDINGAAVQTFISSSKQDAKTISNHILLLRTIWNAAVAWNYIGKEVDWFAGISLPEKIKVEPPCFTEEEMRDIVANAQEPYRTFYWVLAETGIRRGLLEAARLAQSRAEYWRSRQGKGANEMQEHFFLGATQAAEGDATQFRALAGEEVPRGQ